MILSRRQLFSGLVAAGTIAAAPIKFVVKRVCSIRDDFIIDRTTKTIRWTGPPKQTYTAVEFHRFLMEELDDKT